MRKRRRTWRSKSDIDFGQLQKVQRLYAFRHYGCLLQRVKIEPTRIQTAHENGTCTTGPMIQPQNGPAFLTVLTFACEALIACARQLDIMDEECGDGDYGTVLARSAGAIKLAIKEGRLLATRPATTLVQISHIIERETGGSEGGIYSLFFDAAAKSFLRFRNDEQMTASMWLAALTSANKMISEVSGASIGDRTMLDALIPAENRLTQALNSGSNSVDAFGEAVKAAETFAMQTVHMSGTRSADSDRKTLKYPDPGAHAVGIWMRAAYEAVKLKFAYKLQV
ncbi:PREDICTED: putative 3,4-dihydroxy-2-butanone kinase isoform X2 [Vollenhovia emeryi]|uniref:putative 3,4-dihydroxy-2-butanone kinase isoform X2 n=1 Tax=Vollenhovia emeryi TaxID=411798 RepID=UPI0005F43DE9|nr:PREDICTED: putative 3,4-dihydroxy-2-butanone kinase isoform X2 [Vollenhovia emeryi]